MRWDSKLVLTAAWTFAGTSVHMAVPATGPFLLPLTVVMPLLWAPHEGLARRLMARSVLARILAVALVYLLINATWSTSPQLAYIGIAALFVGSVVVHITTTTMPLLARAPVRAMAMGFLAAYILCACLLCFEVLSQHKLHLRVIGLMPSLTPRMSGTVFEGGILTSLPSHFLNEHMTVLMFLLWPAWLVAGSLTASPLGRVLPLLCLIPVVIAVFGSDHETSKLALAASITAFAAFMFVPRTARALLTTAWIFACVAVVPLTSLAYQMQLHRAGWLQPSAQERIVIWGVTSSKTAEAPLLGHGMVTARLAWRQDKERPTFAPGSPYLASTGPYAHNVYLEVWFDTGLVGVALLLGIGLFIMRAISQTAAAYQPALYTAFASNALESASSFSIWSRWFIACYVFSALFAVLAYTFARTARDGTVSDDNAIAAVRAQSVMER